MAFEGNNKTILHAHNIIVHLHRVRERDREGETTLSNGFVLSLVVPEVQAGVV